MKIGFFTDTYFPQINGVTYTIDLWRSELSKRHEVSVYYPADDYVPRKGEIPSRSIAVPFYKGYNLMLPVFNVKGLDVAHIHGFFSSAISALQVAKKNDLPCVLTYHTPVDMYLRYISKSAYIQDPIKVFYKVWENWLLRECDLITIPSEAIKKELGFKEAVVLSNGIDTDFFEPASTKEFKEKHGLDSRVIGFTGRHSYEKHLEDLIGIADDFDGTILIAGDGPANPYFRDLAKGKKNVKFFGFLDREDLPAFYSSLDVFVFSSTAETQGLVALEANACGTPVVGANALALKETISDGVSGFKYCPGDTKDLLDKISKADSSDLSKLCRKFARDHSIEKTVTKLEGLYEGLK